jgi:DNA primase
VEGCFSVMGLWQAGYPAVALMGSSMSEAQERIICANWRRVILLLDGDDAGRTGAADILPRLARHVFVRHINLPDDTQPDHLTPDGLAHILGL